MHIEVDQSGKIEQFNSDTYIACSNEDKYCIMIPKQIKQSIHYNYKSEIKQLKFRLFCIGIYYCISNFINKNPIIILDNEYAGKEVVIKYLLLEILRKNKIILNKKFIQIRQIGKSSNAHILAITTKRGELEPNKKLSTVDIMKLLN